jgi:RHS repeat-associated protein
VLFRAVRIFFLYGFNGKENDNEVKQDDNGNNNIGAQQNYGERIYDPRIGRFLSVDPLEKKYPKLTPYQFASNSPIGAIDIDGLEVGKPQGQDNPFIYFERVADNFQSGIIKQYHNLQSALLSW